MAGVAELSGAGGRSPCRPFAIARAEAHTRSVPELVIHKPRPNLPGHTELVYASLGECCICMDRGLDVIGTSIELLTFMDLVIEHARSIKGRLEVAANEPPATHPSGHVDLPAAWR